MNDKHQKVYKRSHGSEVIILVFCLLLSSCTLTQAKPELTQSTEQLTIAFTDFGVFEEQYKPILAAFQEEHTNIAVQFVPLQGEPGQTGMASQADVIVLPQTPSTSESYTYLDLSPLIATDPTLEVDDFWPGLLSACQIEERTYGLPLFVEPNLIFFDGAAFDQAGIARPTPGWSWDDFQTAALLLSQQADRYGFAGSPIPLLLPQIDSLLQEAGGEVDVTQLEGRLNWYVELGKAGYIYSSGAVAAPQNLEDVITNNRTAMWTEGLYAISNRQQQLGADIGVVSYPAVGGASRTNLMSEYCAAISSGSQNPEAAWTFLQFLTRQAVPTRMQGSVPARISVAQSIGFWETIDPRTEEAVRFALEHGWYGSAYPQALMAVSAALEQAASGERGLGELLSTLTPSVPVAQVTPAQTPVVVAPPPTAVPEQIPDDALIVEWFTSENTEVFKALAEEFNRSQSEVYVRVTTSREAFGAEGYDSNKIIEQYDCYLGYVTTDQIEKVYSLDSLIDADPEGATLAADIPAPFWSSVRMNGSLYGLPVASSTLVIYYNKDHFAQLGLEPPSIDWTMDDFWALASATTTEEVYGFVPAEDYLFLLPTQATQLFYLSVIPPQAYFYTPEMLLAVRMLAEQVQNGVMPMIDRNSYQYFASGSSRRYSIIDEGHAAMWTNYGGYRYGDYEDHGYEVGVVPLPGEMGVLNPGGVGSIVISRHAVDPSGCWQWAKYLSSQPEAFIGVPVRQTVLNSPDYEAAVGVEAAATYRAVMDQPYLDTVPVEIQWQYPIHTVRLMLSNTLYAIFNGADPVPALTEVQHQAEAYLVCIGQAGLYEGDPQYFDKMEACRIQANSEGQ